MNALLPNVTDKVQEGMDLIDSMDKSELDALTDYIRHVYKSKHAMDRARAFASLREKDPVQIVGQTKPQYLEGLTGVITSKRQTRIVVKLDRGPIGKFRSGNVICAPTMLKKLED